MSASFPTDGVTIMSPLGRFLLALAFVVSTLLPFLAFMPAARGQGRPTPTFVAAAAPSTLESISAAEMAARFRVIITQRARTYTGHCPEGMLEQVFNTQYAGVARVDCVEQPSRMVIRERHHSRRHARIVVPTSTNFAASLARFNAWRELGVQYATAMSLVTRGRGHVAVDAMWRAALANFRTVGVSTIVGSLPPNLLVAHR